MTLETDRPPAKDVDVEEILAFDRALASGSHPLPRFEPGSSLHAVHECQRLLEAVWPRSAPLALELPRRFGRYMIERELGRGAFGVVFLASDTVLGRRVALKMPHPEILVTADIRRRFVREAEAASRLDHPHIVPVYDVGEVGPVCYIASAYCEGLTLTEWLRRNHAPVPFVAAARLVATLASAVSHAHARGILHRDLKPSNILLQRPDAWAPANGERSLTLDCVPRICDFGLARLLDQDSHETQSGVPIGSPGYMAPEQAAGRLREHGPATDVYALGAILYELLVGRPPHRGETDLETLRLVTDQDPASPRALRLGVPRDLETLVLKCLEKRPQDRYGIASELAEDLERFADGKPVRARPVRPWQLAAKWARRRPVHAAFVGVTVAAIVVSFGVVFWSGARLHRHHQNLRAAVTQAEHDTRRVERTAQDARVEEARSLEREQSARLADRYALGSQVKLIHETLESGNIGLAAFMLEAHRPAPGRPRPRGFAWRYLERLFQPDEIQLDQEPRYGAAAFLKLALAPHGNTLAAGMSDGRVDLWDLNARRVRRTLLHANGPWDNSIYWLDFSHDGRLLASCSSPRLIKIWDMSTCELVAALPQEFAGEPSHLGGVIELRFTDDDSLAVFAQGWLDRRLEVWFWQVPARGDQPRLRQKVGLKQLPHLGSEGPVKPPSWSPTAEKAAPWLSYARNHLIVLDDGVTLAVKDGPHATLIDPDQHLPAARVHQALAVAAIQDRQHTGLTRNDIERLIRQACRVVGGSGAENRSLGRFDLAKLSPDGRTLAVHIAGMHLGGLGSALIDVASGRTILTNAPARWRVVDFTFSADGRSLFMAGFDSRIRMWRLTPNTLAGHDKETRSLAFSPDGTRIASSSDDGTIKLWDVAGGLLRATLKGHESLVTTVVFSRDGALLASAGFDTTVRLWSGATGRPLATLRGHTGYVRSLAFAPDGRSLASAGDDQTIRRWDLTRSSELGLPLTGHTGGVYSLVFSADGKTLFSGALDKTIRLWDWPAGIAGAVWTANGQVHCLALSPDEETISSGHEQGTVTLWDVGTGKARGTLRRHTGTVLGLASSPDGLTLASAGRDQSVRLWDPATGQELLTLSGHAAPVHTATFSPDGSILATGSHDGAIKLWHSMPQSADRD